MGSRGSLRVSNGVIAAAWHTFDFLSLLSVLRSSPPPLLLPHMTDEVLVYKLMVGRVGRAGLGWGEGGCYFVISQRGEGVSFSIAFPQHETTGLWLMIVSELLV